MLHICCTDKKRYARIILVVYACRSYVDEHIEKYMKFYMEREKKMSVEELYQNIGGDYAAIKARLGKEELIERFVKKFPNEPSYAAMLKAVESGDIEGAFVATHTLKGVVANLSFQKLYEELSVMLEQLRPRQENASPNQLQRVVACYEQVLAEIGKLA